jgi:uncharacterized protein YfiM (DUF2279 family)
MIPLVPFCHAVIKHTQEHDKRQHFGYSLALLLLGALLLPLWSAIVLVVVVGLAKECWDHYWGSGFCWLDMLANMVGIAAGSAFFCLAEYALRL